jgi:hypothetical protein
LLTCVAAGALASIAVARTNSGAASAAYYYEYCPGGAGAQYQYCSTTTSTSTTSTTTTTTTTTTTATTATTTTTTTPRCDDDDEDDGQGHDGHGGHDNARMGGGHDDDCGDDDDDDDHHEHECRARAGWISGREGNAGTTPFVFTITLSKASAAAVTVPYATVAGTAKSPSDYVHTTGAAVFPPGVRTRTVTVQIVGDRVREPLEYFVLSLPSDRCGDGIGFVVNDD